MPIIVRVPHWKGTKHGIMRQQREITIAGTHWVITGTGFVIVYNNDAEVQGFAPGAWDEVETEE